MSTGALKGDKSQKILSDSNSVGVTFQNFLGLLILTSPTSMVMTNLVVPLPLQKSRYASANYCDYCIPYNNYGIVFKSSTMSIPTQVTSLLNRVTVGGGSTAKTRIVSHKRNYTG